MFFLHILILYHLLEEVIFTLYYLYTTTTDGNIFNLLGIASRTLREHGLKEQAKEMSDRVFASGSYGEALCIIGEYVNITDSEPEHKNSLRQQLKTTKPADPVKKQQTSKQQER